MRKQKITKKVLSLEYTTAFSEKELMRVVYERLDAVALAPDQIKAMTIQPAKEPAPK